MSKPMVITLPVIMILLDYWPLKRFQSQKGNLFLWQLKEKLLFFILSIVLVVIILYTPDNINASHLPLLSRLANAPLAFVTYIWKTFWPANLTIFHPFPAYIPAWQVAGASLLIIFTSLTAILLAKRMPYLFTGWLWYVITIVPIIGIVQIGDFAIADRYHYLPSIGIGVMLAWGIPLLFRSENIHKIILFPAAIAFLIFLSFLTWKQCSYWKNSIGLWNHALHVTKNNYMAHNNLAAALLEKGETQKAIYHYNKATSINNYAAAYYNKGVIYYRLGQYQQAIINFHEAISVKTDYAEAYYNLGRVYHFLGQHQLAIKNYNEAIRIMPNHANAYNNRAFIYLNIGNNFSGCSNALKACKLGNCQTLIWAKSKRLCN
jgi:tetratricopeptide (TPR) repeat protein